MRGNTRHAGVSLPWRENNACSRAPFVSGPYRFLDECRGAPAQPCTFAANTGPVSTAHAKLRAMASRWPDWQAWALPELSFRCPTCPKLPEPIILPARYVLEKSVRQPRSRPAGLLAEAAACSGSWKGSPAAGLTDSAAAGGPTAARLLQALPRASLGGRAAQRCDMAPLVVVGDVENRVMAACALQHSNAAHGEHRHVFILLPRQYESVTTTCTRFCLGKRACSRVVHAPRLST